MKVLIFVRGKNMVNNKMMFYIEFITSILIVVWIYTGAIFVSVGIVPVSLFLAASGYLLFLLYGLLFIEIKEKINHV